MSKARLIMQAAVAFHCVAAVANAIPITQITAGKNYPSTWLESPGISIDLETSFEERSDAAGNIEAYRYLYDIKLGSSVGWLSRWGAGSGFTAVFLEDVLVESQAYVKEGGAVQFSVTSKFAPKAVSWSASTKDHDNQPYKQTPKMLNETLVPDLPLGPKGEFPEPLIPKPTPDSTSTLILLGVSLVILRGLSPWLLRNSRMR